MATPLSVTWQTPGSAMTERLLSFEEVAGICEAIDPDRFTVFVLLSANPDSVLDAIFDAETKLYGSFPRTPFDVRVTTELSAWRNQVTSNVVWRFKRGQSY